jgi:hypothetical protein
MAAAAIVMNTGLNRWRSMDDDTALFDCSRIAGGLVELARAKTSTRLLIAGDQTTQLLNELRRRGFENVLNIKNCGLPRGQFAVALVAWQDHSIKALETTLDWLVDFLSPTGVLGIWVGSVELGSHQKLSMALDRLGFRIESGTWVAHGIAVCARRLEIVRAAKAA